MLKISTKGRYGLTIMIELAKKHGEGPTSLKSIAQTNNLSEHYLEQLVSPLRNAGLVKSIRGAYGGYVLGSEPDAITAGDIIRVLEGPISPVEVLEDEEPAKRELWIRIRDAVKEVLDSTTLEDLASYTDGEQEASFKSGFVSIIGRPNVGKSTFLNRVIGQKIAIMSDKPQTTRNKVQGVLTTGTSQTIFIDTPGIHKPKHKLGDFMMKVAQNTLKEVDLILFMINAEEGYGKGDEFIIEKLQTMSTPVFLIVNKIDKIHPDQLLLLIDEYRKRYPFKEIVPISALEGNNIETLLAQIEAYLPEGPQFYPSDQVTDHPERFIISELIREKVLHLTREEIPHSIAVAIESIKGQDNGSVHVAATIVVERDSQKGIVIGKKGSLLKEVGKRARADIEALLGSRVYLELWVKVQKDWRNKMSQLRDFGFKEDEY